MTFSIVARCNNTNMLGMAIASSSPAVAARCSFVEAGIGAVATQNVTNPAIGTYALAQLSQGKSAPEVINQLPGFDQHLNYRQVLIVDRNGTSAIHSGGNALGIWAEAKDTNVAAGGNLLANEQVPTVMVEALLESTGHLGERLLLAMNAGLKQGGEAGPIHSAGIKIVDTVSWPIVDLRCDWTEKCPLHELQTAWAVYQPQISDYISRALDPAIAPGYGVAGDP